MSLQRMQLLAEAQSLTRRSPFTREDSAKVDSLLRLAEAVTPAETKEELRRATLENHERQFRVAIDSASEYDSAFYRWLRSGSKIDLEELREVGRRTVSYTPQTTVSDGTAGGTLIPQGFQNAVLEVMKQTDPLFRESTLVPTPRGNAFNHPIVDDPDGEAEIVDENAAAQDGVILFGRVAWDRCPRWSSGWVLCPLELVQDSLYDLPGLLARIFGTRFARGIGRQFVTTLLSSAASAFTSASASAITGNELLELMTAVDPVYAANGLWLMNFSTYLAISQLTTDTTSEYLFPVQVDSMGTPILCGRRVLICPTMPDLAAGATAIAYGDVRQFLRREVTGSLRLLVANEKWLEAGKFGYQSQLRCDGQLLTASNPSDPSPAMKFITQHS